MKTICINCKYVGAILSKDGLVCSLTTDFKSVSRDYTCNKFIKDKEICICGSRNVSINSFILDDKPYIIRTEYNCKSCKNYWYEDD